MISEVLPSKNLDIFSHFSNLKDPRSGQGRRHLFVDMVSIAICSVLSGADSWVSIEEFAKTQEEWFKTFLELPNGIPSHDAFNDLFCRIDSVNFEKSFIEWTHLISEGLNNIIAIDGKTLKKSGDKLKGVKALHCVSAFCTVNKIVLGQVKTEEKSNEITAIPELLKQLILKGSIITIDAMGCQVDIAQEIINKEADYVLSVKKNQLTTFEELENCFEQASAINFEGVEFIKDEEFEKDHGRIEHRVVNALPASYCENLLEKWPQLRSILQVIREVSRGDKKTKEIAYYISSLDYKNPKLLKAPRAHWAIENSLHWCLDVSYREDDCRIREGCGAENFSILRRLTLNLLRQEKSRKVGIAIKRNIAGWDVQYREKLLKMV